MFIGEQEFMPPEEFALLQDAHRRVAEADLLAKDAHEYRELVVHQAWARHSLTPADKIGSHGEIKRSGVALVD